MTLVVLLSVPRDVYAIKFFKNSRKNQQTTATNKKSKTTPAKNSKDIKISSPSVPGQAAATVSDRLVYRPDGTAVGRGPGALIEPRAPVRHPDVVAGVNAGPTGIVGQGVQPMFSGQSAAAAPSFVPPGAAAAPATAWGAAFPKGGEYGALPNFRPRKDIYVPAPGVKQTATATPGGHNFTRSRSAPAAIDTSPKSQYAKAVQRGPDVDRSNSGYGVLPGRGSAPAVDKRVYVDVKGVVRPENIYQSLTLLPPGPTIYANLTLLPRERAASMGQVPPPVPPGEPQIQRVDSAPALLGTKTYYGRPQSSSESTSANP